MAGRFGVVANGASLGSSSDADRIRLLVNNSSSFTWGCFFQQFTAEGLAAILTQMPLNGAAGDSRFALSTSSGGTGLAIFASSTGSYQTAINGVTAAGTWSAGARTHVAVSYDGSLSAADRFKVYIGGTLSAFATTAGTFPASLSTTSTAYVEALRWDGAQVCPDGIIDTITLHAPALSDANIALLAAGTHVSTGWVDTWPCDDESGETVYSATGNNNGTLLPATTGPKFCARTFAGASSGSGNPTIVMPLGDSELVTSGANGGPRVEVYSRLVADGHYVNFVGSQTTGDPSVTGFDTAHEAVAGKRMGASSGVASTIRADLSARMSTYAPSSYAGRRIIWVRAGKNDLGTDGVTGAQCATRLYDLVTEGESYQPGAHWVLQTPAHWTNGSFNAALADYVAAMPGVVQDLQADGIRAYLADSYALGSTRDLSDGTHENKAGCYKSAGVAYRVMRNILTSAYGDSSAYLIRGGAASSLYARGGAGRSLYLRGGATKAVL